MVGFHICVHMHRQKGRLSRLWIGFFFKGSEFSYITKILSVMIHSTHNELVYHSTGEKV